MRQLNEEQDLEYVGFWPRVGASIIDTILLSAIIGALMAMAYGGQYDTPQAIIKGPTYFLINWVFPAIAVITFWSTLQATPGKMIISAKITDATTGQPPSIGQNIGRYIGYAVSMIPFLLGLIWVAFDRRKQGWHDKLANTVVVRPKRSSADPVNFKHH
ncbi:RDD family protein [Salinisphaera orenii]|uniref:RDD family protein n=1 Tax=Salinisphaera orenii TaxID=856731 RepID=UPI000DBE4B99